MSSVLGHADISTTSRYLKTTRVGLKAYMQQLEAHRAHVADATRTQKKTSAGTIRTSFAHGVKTSDAGDTGSPAKTVGKSLN